MYRLIRAALVLGIAFLLCPVAHAQMFRAYLASYGSDSNPCTVGAPCRLLPAALNAVATNGEIWILDSANFNAGTVTITKNVSIQAIPGQVGSFVAVAGGPALVIASAASVALRNLTVATNASNPGTDGIQAKGGSYVTVENLVFEVRNASNYVAGIRVTESGTRVSVHGSAFHSCYYGVQAGDNTWVEISRSKFSDCQNAAVYAVTALGGSVTTVSVSDSAFGANYIGVFAEGQTVGAIIRVSIMRSSLAGNTYGIASVNDLAGPSTTVTLSGSNVTGNVYGYYQDGATLESTGDNLVRNNNATIGVLTPVSRM